MGNGAIPPCRRSCSERSRSHASIHLFLSCAAALAALPCFQVEVYFTYSLNLICCIFFSPPSSPSHRPLSPCCRGVARGNGLPSRLTSTLFWCPSHEMWSSLLFARLQDKTRLALLLFFSIFVFSRPQNGQTLKMKDMCAFVWYIIYFWIPDKSISRIRFSFVFGVFFLLTLEGCEDVLHAGGGSGTSDIVSNVALQPTV